MKIGVFTDPHYCKADLLCKTRRPNLSLSKIRTAMDAFVEAKVDFCVCLGDLTDHNHEDDTHETVLGYFQEVMALVRSYDIPFYFTPGNHDYHMLSGEELSLGVGLPMPPYTVDAATCRCIFLDGNYRSDMQRFDVGGTKWTDSNLPPEQIDYLYRQLRSATTPCVVLIHENLDPNLEQRHIVKNAEDVRRVIANSGKVILVLQGHYHKGGDNIVDGIRYLTLPAMCEGESVPYQIIDLP